MACAASADKLSGPQAAKSKTAEESSVQKQGDMLGGIVI